MKESTCQFGAQHQLAGILTEPARSRPSSTLVLISAGLVPKYGPYRLYAELARHLATRGVATLRFDLGDIGDSRPVHTGVALEERTRLEIEAALQFLTDRFGAIPVALGGLCSGAEDAFRYAEADPRVTDVVMIDPFAFRTPGWAWRHRAYRSARAVAVALRSLRRVTASAGSSETPRLNYKHMDQGRARRILGTLVARGTRAHFIYTGGARPDFNHAGQLAAMFPGLHFRGLVDVDYFPELEHMQPLQSERQRVVDTIARRWRQVAHAREHDAAVSLAPAFVVSQSSAM